MSGLQKLQVVSIQIIKPLILLTIFIQLIAIYFMFRNIADAFSPKEEHPLAKCYSEQVLPFNLAMEVTDMRLFDFNNREYVGCDFTFSEDVPPNFLRVACDTCADFGIYGTDGRLMWAESFVRLNRCCMELSFVEHANCYTRLKSIDKPKFFVD